MKNEDENEKMKKKKGLKINEGENLKNFGRKKKLGVGRMARRRIKLTKILIATRARGSSERMHKGIRSCMEYDE